MQHNNEDQFRSLRTKNIKIWRKNIISFSKKKKGKDSYLPPPLYGLKKKMTNYHQVLKYIRVPRRFYENTTT